MLISASILSADFSKLGAEITAVDIAGAEWIHLDVMDGHFVPNLTFGPPVIKKLRPFSKKTFDVHLMILQPEKLLQDFIDTGADLITIHLESTSKLPAIFATLKEKSIKCGISIRPATPVETLIPYLSEVDIVLIMSVEPGFGGQKLIPETLKKIEQLVKWREEKKESYHYQIQVDGGINDKTIDMIRKLGVDCIVAGSYIFSQSDYKKPIAILKGKNI